MKNGLVGEFAAQKIRKLALDIERYSSENADYQSSHYASIMSRIKLIGDRRIKAYLLSRMDKGDKDKEIELLKERIKELEKQISNEGH